MALFYAFFNERLHTVVSNSSFLLFYGLGESFNARWALKQDANAKLKY